MIKNQHKSLAGLFTLSALTLAMSGANAALNSSQVGDNGGANNGASSVALTTTDANAVLNNWPWALAGETSIAGSRHNLGSTNTLGSNHTPDVLASDGATVIGTNQICVFCHTPHGFNDSTTSGPLWNREISAGAYTVYNAGSTTSSTFDAATPSIGSVSLACLSCHDGTQAMDSMINAPGFTRGNDNAPNQAVSRGSTWAELASLGQDGTLGAIPSTNSVLVTSINAAHEGLNLGQDLSNDHPISVQYCGGGLATDGTGTCNDDQFRTVSSTASGKLFIDIATASDPDANDGTGSNANSAITRTAGAGDGAKQKSDIPLFLNNAGVVGPSVECASCHDPHTPNNGTFLRVSNYGSGLCLSCHTK